MIDKLFERAAGAVERVLAFAFLIAVGLNFLNVIGRYAFGYTPSGTDEIQTYIMVWMAFAGAAVITWRNQHLRMDVLFQHFPENLRRAVFVFECVVFLAIASFVTLQSYYYVLRMYNLGQVSDLAEIPVWIPHAAVVVGFALMTLVILRRGTGFLLLLLRPTRASAHSTAHKDVASS
jgi:TRAP-type C4-dicarboxylate transport system permease small subunit